MCICVLEKCGVCRYFPTFYFSLAISLAVSSYLSPAFILLYSLFSFYCFQIYKSIAFCNCSSIKRDFQLQHAFARMQCCLTNNVDATQCTVSYAFIGIVACDCTKNEQQKKTGSDWNENKWNRVLLSMFEEVETCTITDLQQVIKGITVGKI